MLLQSPGVPGVVTRRSDEAEGDGTVQEQAGTEDGEAGEFHRFRGWARKHSLVPVWRELSADMLTPVSAFLRVVGAGTGFLLESVEGDERWGRFSFVGRSPQATLLSRGGRLSVTGTLGRVLEERGTVRRDSGMLETLAAVLGALRPPESLDLPPLHGGLVGYLGYEVVREVERLEKPPPDDRGLPDSLMWIIGQLVAFDHWRQRVWLIDNVPTSPEWDERAALGAWEGANRRLDLLQRDLSSPVLPDETVIVEPPASRGVGGPRRGGGSSYGGKETGEDRGGQAGLLPEGVRRTMSADRFQDAVRSAKESILEGDIFQVVLSQRFDTALGADPFDCYRVLRQLNPSPYMYYLQHPEISVVGSSPEPLVRLEGRRVVSRPIAGTRWRGATEAEDRRLAAELAEDPKERAEHVMLVDLARNDVGRVARYGTQVVEELMTLERYSHVMHLTSQVSGELREGLGPVEVLAATLPAGTVSGAPKVRAMELIDEHEPTRRGPYAGVVGYVDFDGDMDMAITIRTMFVGPDGVASIQAGAGIVADSDPATEDRECIGKAAALLATVEPGRRLSEARRAAGGGRQFGRSGS